MALKGALIAPYEDLLELVEYLKRRRKWNLEVVLGDLFEGVKIARELVEDGVAFIVSRGGTFELIRKAFTEYLVRGGRVPIIEIKVDAEDLLQELSSLRRDHGQMALAGFENVIRSYRGLARFLELPLDYVVFNDPEKVEELITQAAKRGVEFFLTDTIGSKVARSLGLKARLIRSSDRAVIEAVEMAIYLAETRGFSGTIAEGGAALPGRAREELADRSYSYFVPKIRAREKSSVPPEVPTVARFSFEDIVYSSQIMEQVIERARIFAATDSPILITGETGTGKELLAHSIHLASSRRKGPFVTVACGAIPPSLLAAELMGYSGGAFTGARREGRIGLFEAAHGGTIFLDEIQDLPLEVQGMILRFLQEGEVRKLGENRVFRLDVRIIAASNRDLLSLVRERKFRQDLYYRLNVLNLHIPPLRERKEDIIPLAFHFLRLYARQLNKDIVRIAPEAQEALLTYDFPGNVRELAAIIERAVLLCNGSEIKPQMIELPTIKTPNNYFVERNDSTGQLPVYFSGPGNYNENLRGIRPLREVEREHIVKVYQATGGNIKETARLLGISRTTLWRRLKEYLLL
ncbi:regulatory protein, Fis family [Thermanaeromonas toyohensis ToBE]|uniref:Regulatory protein, Fis family n=1 Tax=Thermanaeromonas toyohensis ToBE TaxID=698762 RepID=A0A1W1W1H6_9FIRM|nr:sigma-54-dependent Fis family transcriptional regulator [Thermanaeromonas toyohensis]SMB98954.1 regulatory protein, Fis family [Thermanaeromonas toyohensis ToBE]